MMMLFWYLGSCCSPNCSRHRERQNHVSREVIDASLQHLSPYIGNFLYFGGIDWDYSLKAKFILPLLGLFLVI